MAVHQDGDIGVTRLNSFQQTFLLIIGIARPRALEGHRLSGVILVKA